MVPEEGQKTPPPESIAIWAEYAKDRFNDSSRRVDEFRNWSRQLAGIIAVAIGLEANLVRQFVVAGESMGSWIHAFLALMFLLVIVSQLVQLFSALTTGYVGRQVRGPESPAVLVSHVRDLDGVEMRRTLGAYYAKSEREFHELSETIGQEVAQTSLWFARSLILLAVVVGTRVLLALV